MRNRCVRAGCILVTMAESPDISPSGQPIHVDDQGTIITVTYYSGATDEQYEAHLAEMDAIVERNKRRIGSWVVINDTTRWMKSNANQRKMHAAWMSRHEDMMRARTAGVAFVIDNAIVRGGLTAVLWLAPLPCPHCIVKTMAEAKRWAQQRLEETSPESLQQRAL